MLATCLSSALLGCFMCALVMLCRKIRVDPGESSRLHSHLSERTDIALNLDNIAPPVAACLGDLVPLVLLGAVSALNVHFVHSPLPLVIMTVLAAGTGVWVVIIRRNDYVGHLLWQGWLPLFVAMVISCAAGMVLDMYVGRYEGFAVLAMLISGQYAGAPRVLCAEVTMKDCLEMSAPSWCRGYRLPSIQATTQWAACPTPLQIASAEYLQCPLQARVSL